MIASDCTLNAGAFAMQSVDRENGVIRGVVAAEVGEFKSGRGSFGQNELSMIVNVINSNERGVLSFFGHPKSGNDVERPYLGTIRNARVDGDKVRVDLHLSKVAMKPQPNTGSDRTWGDHLLDLAEEEPRALGFSLSPKSIVKKQNPSGEAPLWEITALRSGDVVLEGDATSSFLNAGDSPGVADSSDQADPDLEDIQLNADQLKEMLESLVPQSVEQALAARDAQAEKLSREQELNQREADLAAKEKKIELSLSASRFAERALAKMPAEEVEGLSSKIRDGELSYESALEKLADYSSKPMDAGTVEPQDDADAALKKEYQLAIESGLELGSFEDYKNTLSDDFKLPL